MASQANSQDTTQRVLPRSPREVFALHVIATINNQFGEWSAEDGDLASSVVDAATRTALRAFDKSNGDVALAKNVLHSALDRIALAVADRSILSADTRDSLIADIRSVVTCVTLQVPDHACM